MGVYKMTDTGKREVSLEELISTLERSSLPTIVVEGKYDIIIYRKIEELLEDIVDVLPAGGRGKVLGIFDSIKTNPKLQAKKLIFIDDKDTWVNTGIPTKYQQDILIFTNGYSIENDVFIDYGCEQILEIEDSSIKNQFLADKEKFIHWYALALQATLNGENLTKEREIARDPNEVLGNEYSKFIALTANEIYPTELQSNLKENYPLQIRGKSLLNLFRKHLKHHSSKAMFQKVAIEPKTSINRIFDDVKKQF